MRTQLSSLSGVDAPRWGVRTTFLTPMSASSGKSVTYTRSWPWASASYTSFTFTSGPRAKFRSAAVFFMREMAAASIRPRLSSVSGTCSVM